MLEFARSALSALATATVNPLAIVGYIAVILSWTIIALKVKRNKQILDRIESFPENDRLNILRIEMGEVSVPPNLTPEQWLQSKIDSNKLIRFWIIAAVVILIFAISAFSFLKNQEIKVQQSLENEIEEINESKKVNEGSAKIELHTKGNQSPAIISDGNINIKFGNEENNEKDTNK